MENIAGHISTSATLGQLLSYSVYTPWRSVSGNDMVERCREPTSYTQGHQNTTACPWWSSFAYELCCELGPSFVCQGQRQGCAWSRSGLPPNQGIWRGRASPQKISPCHHVSTSSVGQIRALMKLRKLLRMIQKTRLDAGKFLFLMCHTKGGISISMVINASKGSAIAAAETEYWGAAMITTYRLG